MRILSRILDSRTLWLSEQSALLPIIHKAADGDREDDPQSPMPWDSPMYAVENGVAVISIRGVIVRECSALDAWYFGLCSSSRISEAIKAAEADPSIAGILLDIDSPGGECCGTPECADVVAACRKPVASWSGGLMASAAYYIGSHARYVTAAKSANVGSIGVICTTYDLSAYYARIGIKPEVFTDSPLKGTGHPDKPMTDDQRAYLQASVDQIGVSFRAAISARMPAKPEAMQGQCFIGAPAVAAGLIHEITTRDGAVAGLRLLPPAASNTITMTLPESLAAAESKLTAQTSELAALKLELATSNEAAAKIKADAEDASTAYAAEIATIKAELSAKTAELSSVSAEASTLKAAAKTADQKAAEMLAQVGQSPVVPAVEKKGSAGAAKPLTGLDRAIAAARALVAKN